MSNEIKTHRFIVTVPDLAEEEADIFASDLEEVMPRRFGSKFGRSVKVEHALGASLPATVRVVPVNADGMRLSIDNMAGPGAAVTWLTAYEARQLAGTLIAIAQRTKQPE